MRVDSRSQLGDWAGGTVRLEGERLDRDPLAARLVITTPTGVDEVLVADLLTWARQESTWAL